MINQKVTLNASDFCGAKPAMFQGKEWINAPSFPAGNCVNTSSRRKCCPLASKPLTTTFRWQAAGNHTLILRVRGMWDFYKEIPAELQKAAQKMITSGTFCIKINNKIIFDKPVHFWNYRKWRFWPAFEFIVPDEVLIDGLNELEIVNLTEPFRTLNNSEFSDDILENTVFQLSDIQIFSADFSAENRPLPLQKSDYLIGHTIGGHYATYIEGDDLQLPLRVFRSTQQGNLIVILISARKTGYILDLDKIDVDYIQQTGLKVALRYYGENSGPMMKEQAFQARVKRFVERLGDSFIGFCPHEQHLAMDSCIAAADNPLPEMISLEYKSRFAKRVNAIRQVSDASIWDTDPSFYSHFHIEEGAVEPAIEFTVGNCSLLAASGRGAARAFKCDHWTAINSFECQAFGGLSMKDSDAEYYPDLLKKRQNLWLVTQRMLLFGGAKKIYTESGGYEHRLVHQAEFDSEHICDMRKIQSQLIEFIEDQPLPGLPNVEIGFLQGQGDIYRGLGLETGLSSVMGTSIQSWRLLQAVFPNLIFDPNTIQFQDGSFSARDLISDCPFGNADIIPNAAPITALNNYRHLIMCGWNRMDSVQADKLVQYVQDGGTLFLMLPHLMNEGADSGCNQIDTQLLTTLFGCEINNPFRGIPLNMPRLTCHVDKYFSYTRQELDKSPQTARFRMANYGTTMPEISSNSSCCQVILFDKASGMPLVTENRLGKGKAYLVNIDQFPQHIEFYNLMIAVIRDIISANPPEVTLASGQGVDYYVFNNPDGNGHDLYAFRNDWYTIDRTQEVTFNVNGRIIPAEINNNDLFHIKLSQQGTKE